MSMRRCSFAFSVVGLLACTTTTGVGAEASRATVQTASCLVMSDATDGEFTRSLRIETDGRWTERDHVGERSGQLDDQRLGHLVAALDAAPWSSEPPACSGPRPSFVTLTDCRKDRSVRVVSSLAADGSVCRSGADPKSISLVDEINESLPRER